MKTSDAINEISEAMALAQGSMKPASKDNINPFFKSRYTTLTQLWETIKEPLSKNSLSVLQDVTSSPVGVSVTTRVCHKSGQWIEFGPLEIPAQKKDAQGFGSAASYGRRYALSAALGIVSDEDDDGNAATQTKNSTAQANGNGNQNVAKQKKEDQTISEEEYKAMMQVVSSYPLLIKELQAICKTQDLRHIPKTQLKACGLYAKKYIENIDKQEVEDVTV